MKRVSILLLTTALMAGVVAQTGRIELQATLTGIGKGKAKFKVRGTKEAELQVEGENSLRNTAMTVTVGNLSYNTTSDAFGRFRVSQRFTGANIPNIAVGTNVAVTYNNGVVMAGSF